MPTGHACAGPVTRMQAWPAAVHHYRRVSRSSSFRYAELFHKLGSGRRKLCSSLPHGCGNGRYQLHSARRRRNRVGGWNVSTRGGQQCLSEMPETDRRHHTYAHILPVDKIVSDLDTSYV